MDIMADSIELAGIAAISKGIGGIIYVLDEDRIEVHNLLTREVKVTGIAELMGNI
jgi:ATP phosphoribosyltransferase regulatory subunit